MGEKLSTNQVSATLHSQLIRSLPSKIPIKRIVEWDWKVTNKMKISRGMQRRNSWHPRHCFQINLPNNGPLNQIRCIQSVTAFLHPLGISRTFQTAGLWEKLSESVFFIYLFYFINTWSRPYRLFRLIRVAEYCPCRVLNVVKKKKNDWLACLRLVLMPSTGNYSEVSDVSPTVGLGMMENFTMKPSPVLEPM